MTGPDRAEAPSPEFESAALGRDFGSFAASIRTELMGALVLRTGSRPVAEDLTHEALARVLADWPRVGHLENPRGWTFRVAFNLAASHHRRARMSRLLAPMLARPDHGISEELTSVDNLLLRAALGELTRRQQEVIILRHYAGMSERDTADALGVSIGTVKTLGHRGRATLRRHLDAAELADEGGPES